MRRAAVRRQVSAVESDAALAVSASQGDSHAFEELYRRHVSTAWGVAYAIVHDRDDAGDAVGEAFANVLRSIQSPSAAARLERLEFRSYLLAAVRNAAIDVLRRSKRVEPTPDLEPWDVARGGDGGHSEPGNRVVAREDQAFVTEAFSRLPERWRSALWLIDVEQLSTKEAGTILGVSPNNVAQLATRARSRLRQEYLQAHVPNHIRPECRVTVEILGSYAAGTATTQRTARVKAHLESCPECRSRMAELGDLGVALRRALPPLPVGLTLGRRSRPHVSLRDLWERATAKPSVAALTHPVDLPALVPHMAAASPVVERVLAGVSAVVLVAGVSTMAARTRDAEPPQDPSSAAAAPSLSHGGAAPNPQSAAGATPRLTPQSATAGGSPTNAASNPSDRVPNALASPSGNPARASGNPAPAANLAPASGSPAPANLAPASGSPANSAGTVAAVSSNAAPTSADTAPAPANPAPASGSPANAAGNTGPGASPSLAGSATAVSAALIPGIASSALGPPELSASGTADLVRVVPTSVGGVVSGVPTAFTADGSPLPATGPFPNLAGAQLEGINLSGVDLAGAQLQSANLARTDLTGADLSHANLAGADLTGATLSGANLTGATLSGANLTGATLSGANLAAANLSGATLEGATLTRTSLAGVDLSQANLTGVALDPVASALSGAPAALGAGPVALPTASLPATASLSGAPAALGAGPAALPTASLPATAAALPMPALAGVANPVAPSFTALVTGVPSVATGSPLPALPTVPASVGARPAVSSLPVPSVPVAEALVVAPPASLDTASPLPALPTVASASALPVPSVVPAAPASGAPTSALLALLLPTGPSPQSPSLPLGAPDPSAAPLPLVAGPLPSAPLEPSRLPLTTAPLLAAVPEPAPVPLGPAPAPVLLGPAPAPVLLGPAPLVGAAPLPPVVPTIPPTAPAPLPGLPPLPGSLPLLTLGH